MRDNLELTAVTDNGPYKAYCGPIGRFYWRLFNPAFHYVRDLYPLMFLMDVIAFLIVAFGYSAFGEGGSGSVSLFTLIADCQFSSDSSDVYANLTMIC